MALDEPISFDQWIAYVFDHPATEPAWYWDTASDDWNGRPTDVVAFFTRTFEECDTVLGCFSDAQVAQGLNFLVSPSCSNYAFTLLETGVPLADRVHCIEAMEALFARCFAVRWSSHLSHLDVEVPPEDVSPLNGTCYIWWDVLPLHGLVVHQPDHPDAAELDRAIMAVIGRILKLDFVACQESALFGLASCGIYYPKANAVIDDFIKDHPDLFQRFKQGIREAVFGRP